MGPGSDNQIALGVLYSQTKTWRCECNPTSSHHQQECIQHSRDQLWSQPQTQLESSIRSLLQCIPRSILSYKWAGSTWCTCTFAISHLEKSTPSPKPVIHLHSLLDMTQWMYPLFVFLRAGEDLWVSLYKMWLRQDQSAASSPLMEVRRPAILSPSPYAQVVSCLFACDDCHLRAKAM